jgi:hypothetical protein
MTSIKVHTEHHNSGLAYGPSDVQMMCLRDDKNQVSHRAPQFLIDLRTLLLSGALYSVHVNWHSIVYKESNCSNFAENIRRRRKKFARYLCTPVVHSAQVLVLN